MNKMSEEEEKRVCTLINDEGEEITLDFLGEVRSLGKDYLVLSDSSEAEGDILSVTVVEVLDDGNYQVVDEALFSNILDLFIQENPDDYVFSK